MSPKRWLTTFLCIVLAFLVLVGGTVIWLDPFYHYHAPRKDFYYVLGDQRYQNDGITRHFQYDAIITGTSMIENFRTSELDAQLGTSSIKIPYPGATYKEINDNLQKAFATHDDIRYVVRALDLSHLIEDKDAMRTDMGEYPDYLYDRNLLNDVKYLYNSSVIFEYVLPMLVRRAEGVPGGVSSFDDYSWSGDDAYSAAVALDGKTEFTRAAEQPGLSAEQQEMVRSNILQNVVDLAKAEPDTMFLYFFPPYSAAWYGECLEEGTFQQYLEAEKLAADLMLTAPNIRIFLFSSDTAVTTDMDLYKDVAHYSPAVSSEILSYMTAAVSGTNPAPAGQDDQAAGLGYEVTAETVDGLFGAEEEIYQKMDYNKLLAQARAETQ